MKEIRCNSLSSIDKALSIIEFIATSEEIATHSKIASQTGMNLNKTLGMLNLLCERGYIEQDKAHGGYLVGVKGIQISQNIINSISILKYARPVMMNLEKAHDEAIYVAVLKETDVFFLDMVDSDQSIKAASLIGQSFPFFSNAAGKVIMAFSPMEYLQRYLTKSNRRCPQINISLFEEELHLIRDRGVAVEVGGLGDNVTSVAVVIKDYAGKVLGALTMIAPSFRLIGERLEKEIIPSMVESAHMLSTRFGYVVA